MNVLPELRAQLVAAATVQPRRARFGARARGRRMLVPVVAVLCLSTGVAVAATAIIATSLQDRSAALTLGAPKTGDTGRALHYGTEMAAAAARIQTTVPYPPGKMDHFVWTTYRPDPGAPAEAEGSLRMFIEHRASCLWRGYWVDASNRHDDAAVQAAAAILQDIPSWAGIRGDRGEGPERARQVAAWVAAGNVNSVAATLSGECRGIS
jgi:hypothetical protein